MRGWDGDPHAGSQADLECRLHASQQDSCRLLTSCQEEKCGGPTRETRGSFSSGPRESSLRQGPVTCSAAEGVTLHLNLNQGVTASTGMLTMKSWKRIFFFMEFQQGTDDLQETQQTGAIGVISEEKDRSEDKMGQAPVANGCQFQPCSGPVSVKQQEQEF
ncbi:hypothetical protein CB1_000668007 [Camelus ferus]|nr:hypothetical protein CB1_000668007 [Camelus ferus]